MAVAEAGKKEEEVEEVVMVEQVVVVQCEVGGGWRGGSRMEWVEWEDIW